MGTWFSLLCFQSWRVCLEVSFAAPSELTVVLALVQSIVLGTLWTLDSTQKGTMIFKYDFNWRSLGTWTSSKLTLSILFTYLSMAWRSDWDTTKFEIMVIPKLSGQMKSTMTFNLMFFKALLMLVICSLANAKMLLTLTLLISTIICFLDGPFMVMFKWGFTLFRLLMILWIPSVFFARRLKKCYKLKILE